MFDDSDQEDKAYAAYNESSTQTRSAKVAPSYNGNTSGFQCEELIDEWYDLTTVDPSKGVLT